MGTWTGKGIAAGVLGIAVFSMVGALLLMDAPQKPPLKQTAEVKRSSYRSKIVPVEEARPITTKAAAVTTGVKAPAQLPGADPAVNEMARKKTPALLKLEERTSIGTVKNGSSRVKAVVPQITTLKLKKATTFTSTGALHSAWAIQLEDFSDSEKATRLRDRLQSAGFASFIETEEVDGHAMSRVYVGPEKTRHAAKEVLAQLQKRQGIKGTVVAY